MIGLESLRKKSHTWVLQLHCSILLETLFKVGAMPSNFLQNQIMEGGTVTVVDQF